MPPPSHRLDLLLAPPDPERQADEGDAAWWAAGIGEGWWTVDGAPGPAAALVAGGFVRARLERAPAGAWLGNQQGGVQVRCPACGAGLAVAAGKALRSWQAGGARSVTCGACGAIADLAALPWRPPAALARVWLWLADVGSGDPGPALTGALRACWGGVSVVPRRVG